MQHEHAEAIRDSPLSNGDLAPTTPGRRTWGTYHLAALWVGLSIVITTYTLASGLIAAGMTWWQGLLTVSLGNLIVLVPILLMAFGISAVTYVALSAAARTEPSTAAVAE